MTKQITLEEALKLVSFAKDEDGKWQVEDVCSDIHGYVLGDVYGNVYGSIWGSVDGDIKSGEWQRVETPKEKFQRLIEEGSRSEISPVFKEQLLEAFNQLEEN